MTSGAAEGVKTSGGPTRERRQGERKSSRADAMTTAEFGTVGVWDPMKVSQQI